MQAGTRGQQVCIERLLPSSVSLVRAGAAHAERALTSDNGERGHSAVMAVEMPHGA